MLVKCCRLVHCRHWKHWPLGKLDLQHWVEFEDMGATLIPLHYKFVKDVIFYLSYNSMGILSCLST
jgi:hypothetical protein